MEERDNLFQNSPLKLDIHRQKKKKINFNLTYLNRKQNYKTFRKKKSQDLKTMPWARLALKALFTK